jgi:hypothetical protein
MSSTYYAGVTIIKRMLSHFHGISRYYSQLGGLVQIQGLGEASRLSSPPCQPTFSVIFLLFVVPLSFLELQATMIRQIQKRPPGSNASPLFLIHDASGTIATYRALGPLGRDVYAIADTGTKCDVNESVQEMGRRYYALIKSQVAEGRILLGGKIC